MYIYKIDCGSDKDFKEPPNKGRIYKRGYFYNKNLKTINKRNKMKKNYTYQPNAPKAGKVADKGCDTLNGCGMSNSVS